MNRVFRSCLDPLPRFLSTRGLAFVVLLVVGGTGFSVYEYVQSGRSTNHAWPRSTVRAAEGTERASPLRSCGAYASAQPCLEADADPVAVPSVLNGTAGAHPSPATLYRPESSSSGS